jgi:predicted metalloprotease
MQQVRQSDGDFRVAYVVAHELGHNVQHLLGITKLNAYILFGQFFSREIELQADCLAGVWSKSATDRSLAAPEDITQALTLAWTLGDPSWSSQRASDAHGTPNDRTTAFLNGFNGSSATACGIS